MFKITIEQEGEETVVFETNSAVVISAVDNGDKVRADYGVLLEDSGAAEVNAIIKAFAQAKSEMRQALKRGQ